MKVEELSKAHDKLIYSIISRHFSDDARHGVDIAFTATRCFRIGRETFTAFEGDATVREAIKAAKEKFCFDELERLGKLPKSYRGKIDRLIEDAMLTGLKMEAGMLPEIE
jgi:hypothetical protein